MRCKGSSCSLLSGEQRHQIGSSCLHAENFELELASFLYVAVSVPRASTAAFRAADIVVEDEESAESSEEVSDPAVDPASAVDDSGAQALKSRPGPDVRRCKTVSYLRKGTAAASSSAGTAGVALSSPSSCTSGRQAGFLMTAAGFFLLAAFADAFGADALAAAALSSIRFGISLTI